jgi:hypothetical protein
MASSTPWRSIRLGTPPSPTRARPTAVRAISSNTFDGAHWNKQTVGTGGGWCTLAFSPAGDPAISHVVWRSSTDTIVMSAALSGGTWHLEPIAYQAGTPSLAFTPAGEPAVSYHDRASATVKYAVFADRTWQHFLVDQTGKDQNGMWRGDFTLTSLAISPSGQPAISYFDRHDGGIKCAIGTVTVGGVRGGNWWSRLRDFLAFRTTR